MPSKIRLLPQHVINVIAAGEVVENPACVVKELVENSLDAGANKIEVDCLAGGFQRIRIEDNGIGMNADDALLSLERHATSKLKTADDLFSLTSMGFRGEALASIAAISRMTLTTAQEGVLGTRVICEGGKILTVEKVARARGTTIEIQNLFYNVPARKKFQKSATSSQAEISRLITRLAIGFPDCNFIYRAGHTTLLSTKNSSVKGEQRRQERIKELLGEEFVSHMIPLHFEREDVSLEGYVGLPFKGKHNRSGQFLYINQRVVVSEFVEESIQRAYGHSLDSKQFPMYLLYMQLPTHFVDVNVHPQKKEIRFQDELWIDAILKEAISSALGYRFSVEVPLSFSAPLSTKSLSEEKGPTTNWEIPEVVEVAPFDQSEQIQFCLSPQFAYVFQGFGFFSVDEEESRLFDSFCSGGGLMLVDLRRLYQRVLFDSCLLRLQGMKEKFSLQKLFFPIAVGINSLLSPDFNILQPLFYSLGISLIQRETNFEVDALSSHIAEETLPLLLQEAIAVIERYDDARILSAEAQEDLARVFVKKSRSKEISLNEANQLLEQYLQEKRSQYSPFGEPIFALLGSDEIKQVLRSYQKNPSADGRERSRPSMD